MMDMLQERERERTRLAVRTTSLAEASRSSLKCIRYASEVIGDVAWTSFQGELDRYTCLQELLCHPSSRIPRCRICVRTPADEIVSNNQALITRSTMSLNDLGHFVRSVPHFIHSKSHGSLTHSQL